MRQPHSTHLSMFCDWGMRYSLGVRSKSRTDFASLSIFRFRECKTKMIVSSRKFSSSWLLSSAVLVVDVQDICFVFFFARLFLVLRIFVLPSEAYIISNIQAFFPSKTRIFFKRQKVVSDMFGSLLGPNPSSSFVFCRDFFKERSTARLLLDTTSLKIGLF